MPQSRRSSISHLLCAAVATATLLLAACSREADDWRATQAADTVASYEQFLRQYPGSTHATDATTRVGQLAEDEAWQLATSQDTQAGYQQFITRYPEGKWAQEARVRVENFALSQPPAADSPAAVMAGMAGTPAPGAAGRPVVTPPALPAPPAVKNLPAPVAASPEKVPPVAKSTAPVKSPASSRKTAEKASGFGAQLGAYSSKEKAEAQWKLLSTHYNAQLGKAKHRVVAGKAKGKTLYRLQVPQASEAKARELCARLKTKHQACVVFHP
jgi:hypothetical protein